LTSAGRNSLPLSEKARITDTPFAFEENFESISRYRCFDAAFEALEEEAILVVALKVYQAE
jgi:hypothetical protein